MKKVYQCLFVLWLLSAAILLYAACSKRQGHPTTPASEDRLFMDEAHAYFNDHVLPLPLPHGDVSVADARSGLPKTVLWNRAYVQQTSRRKVVVVPIAVDVPLYIKRDNGSVSLSASDITFLLLYKDAFQEWHGEVMTGIPDDNRLRKATALHFTGKVRVEDWQGNYLRGFLFKKDSIVSLPVSRTFRRAVSADEDEPPRTGSRTSEAVAPISKPGGRLSEAGTPTTKLLSSGPIQSLTAVANPPASNECEETDWYACSTIGGEALECQYEYTTEECPDPTYYSGILGTDGDLTGGDYGTLAAGGGIGATSGKPAVQKITPDTSITRHPNVNCVYTQLMSAVLKNGLKSILSSFDDNEVYNITFSVAPGLPGDGMTSYLGNNDFLVRINQSEADDPDFSRIYLASTFIHESFHAKLRQKALETFGTAAIADWPQPIDDMTLSELASYFEQNAKAANIWEGVEHDWMVNNIDQMAASLEEYVETYYKTTFAAVGSGLSPYEAVMYMGLQGSTLYQEEVVETGKVNSFQTYWRDLNEGGKCQN